MVSWVGDGSATKKESRESTAKKALLGLTKDENRGVPVRCSGKNKNRTFFAERTVKNLVTNVTVTNVTVTGFLFINTKTLNVHRSCQRTLGNTLRKRKGTLYRFLAHPVYQKATRDEALLLSNVG